MKFKNTLQRGSIRYLIFQEEDTWYGVCLEFNIVESGSTREEAWLLLHEAIQGYVEAARKVKMRPHILNQKTDSEYEMIWSKRKESPVSNGRATRLYEFGEVLLSGLRDRVAVSA